MIKFKLDTTEGIILCKARLANKTQSIFIKLAVDTGASLTSLFDIPYSLFNPFPIILIS